MMIGHDCASSDCCCELTADVTMLLYRYRSVTIIITVVIVIQGAFKKLCNVL